MPDGSEGWLPSNEAFNQPLKWYTVEIAWKAKGSVCPLTWWQRNTRQLWQEGTKFISHSEAPMVNMK